MSDSNSTASPLHAEVADRFGVLPNFFRLAPETPEVTANLWGFARFGYLDNPLPPLFKERLFVYLSRFCEVRYCIARHVGFLAGLGRPSGDPTCPPATVEQVVRLIRRPLPRGSDLEPHLERLEEGAEPLPAVPGSDTPLEEAVFACATHVFLQTPQAARCLEALRRAFGGVLFQHLLVFLGFVRTAHFWTKVHPELKFEDDIAGLLAVNEALAECALNDPEAATCETTQVLLDEAASLRREREQAELLRVTLASIGDAVIATDTECRITSLNPVAESLTGWASADAVGRPLVTVFHIVNETTRRPVENPATKAVREGVVVGLANHTVLIARDGTERPIDDSAAPIRSAGGEVVGCVLVFRDVTERRRAEQRLQESELRYRLVGQAANDAIWDWDLVTNQVTWNEGLRRAFGYAAEQVGHDASWWVEHIHPDDRDRVAHGIHAAIDGGQELWHDEYRYRRADGSHAEVLDRGRVVREGGRPVRMVGSMLDLTERKRAEATLRESEERFRALVTATAQVVWTTDPQGQVVEDSPTWRAFTGQTVDQWRGWGWLDSVHPDDRERTAAAWRRAVEGKSVCTVEYRLWRHDGEYRWTAVRAVPVLNADDSVREWIGTNTDVGDRKLDESLRAGQRHILEMIATSRPLAAVLAAVCRLIEELEPGLLCSILLADEGGRHTGDGVGPSLPDEFVRALQGIAIAPPHVGSCCKALDCGEEVVVADVENDERWSPLWRDLNLSHGLRACRSIPIVGSDGAVLASVAVFRRQPGDPGPSNKELLGIAAHLAGIAIERKRAEEALNERVRLLSLGAAVGVALVQSDELRSMLQHCAEALVEHLDVAFARIWTLESQADVLELQASAGLYTHLDGPHSRVPVGQFKIGLIAQERKPHLTNAVVGDPRVGDQEWARREGMVAFAGYPLLVEDRVVGVVATFARRPLSQATLEAMASVANGIASGIERKRARERLGEQREWLRVTLASIGDAVITTDTLGRVTFLNPVAAELTGWPQAEAQGRPLEAVFHILNEQTRQPVENPVEKVLRDGAIVGLGNHTVLIARDGTERPIDDSAAPIRDAAGGLIGVVLIFRDVTEQRRAERELRASEARKSAILETALDCIITMDHEGKVVEFNPAAEQTFGYRREEIVGQELCRFVIPPPLREPHRQGMARYLATGEGPVLGRRLELPALRADGTEFPVEVAITRITYDGPPLFTAYLRDITELKRAERQRNARLAVTQTLTEAAEADDGTLGVLQAVCVNLGWDVGLFWTVSDDGAVLACRQSWHLPDVPVTQFERDSRGRTFVKGEGLPGRVWATGEPAWILDVAHDANFSRAPLAAQDGLRSGFACPVLVGERFLGVIEFFSRRTEQPDPGLLEMMGTVAGSVGQFIERRSAEDHLRQSEAELADFFENATIGLHWVGPDGTILRANQAELAMLGFSREEYVGRSIADFHADEDVIGDILRRLQAGEQLHEYPARLRCKDGSIRDVLIDSSVMFRDGGFVHTRCFTRDVTDRKRLEESLRSSEAHLRAVVETTPACIKVVAADGTLVSMNSAGLRMVDAHRSEDVEGGCVYDLIRPPYRDAFREFNERVCRGESGTLEFEIEGLRGTRRHMETHAAPLPGPDGSVRQLAITYDITDRKRAEAARRESEEKLRLLADTIPQLAWMARPDGHIFWYNRRWYEYTGTTPEQMEGWGWQSVHDPAVLPHVLERWKASLASGEPFDMVFPLKGADGRFRPFLTRVNPLRDERGRTLYWFGTNTDVSEQQRAADTSRFLAEASATLAAVVDYESTLGKVAKLAVPFFADWCAVDVAGEDGTLRRLAVAHSDPSKVALADELHRRYPPRPDDPYGPPHVLLTGRPEMAAEVTDEILVASAQGDDHLRILRELNLRSYLCVPLVVRSRPMGVLTFIVSEAGRAYGPADLELANELAHRAAIAVDNARLYQELREADRRKDEFLATLAHELRNPLAPIRNSLQVLKMGQVDSRTAQQVRGMMERQVDHLVRLVDDLLDISRVMRGKIELRREKVELASVVARAVETAQPLIEVQGHRLDLDLPPESLLVDADPVRLSQVVGNLLTNAAKYTDANGHIRLTARREAGAAVLAVRDNGIGIAREMLPRVFELFVQVDHASTRAQGGLGIGLTLVKNLVEMHGGTVEAHSAGLGRGSEFVLRLPLVAQVPPATAADEGVGRRQERTSSGLRLLVVDDNQDAANSLALLLRLQGHEVRVAHDGPAALELAAPFFPHAVFLDIGMPKMDGYEVARRLRQTPGLERVVLTALTGWGQQEDRRRSAEAGFDHHLVKPPEPQALESMLGELRRGG